MSDINEIDMPLEELIKSKGKEGIKYRHPRTYYRNRFKRENQIQNGKDYRRRLKVENLRPEMQNSELSELFGKFGKLTRCGIHFDKLGKSIGVADIEYSTHEEAEEAKNKLNEADINGEKITVRYTSSSFGPFGRNRNRFRQRRTFSRNKYRNRNQNIRFRYRRLRRIRRFRNRNVGLGRMPPRNGGLGHRKVFLRSIGRRRVRNFQKEKKF